MIEVRVFAEGSSPTDEVISDVEVPAPPLVGDMIEFVEAGGAKTVYEVTGRVHVFGLFGSPRAGLLAVAVKQRAPRTYDIRDLAS